MPGAPIAISDWFRSEASFTPEMRDWATEGDETYEMDTLASAAEHLQAAGFTDPDLGDSNDWFRDYSLDEYERLKGPLFAEFAERFGDADARQSVENARMRALLAEQGQLRPGHIRAVRPR